MTLTEPQKKYLRGLGHDLKPVIMVGDSGLSENLINELESTISHHELIKVRVRSADRQSRDATIEDLCAKCQSNLITRIGNVALLYRPNEEKPKIRLPTR